MFEFEEDPFCSSLDLGRCNSIRVKNKSRKLTVHVGPKERAKEQKKTE